MAHKASDYIQSRVLNIRFCTHLMGPPFFFWAIPTYRVLPYSMIIYRLETLRWCVKLILLLGVIVSGKQLTIANTNCTYLNTIDKINVKQLHAHFVGQLHVEPELECPEQQQLIPGHTVLQLPVELSHLQGRAVLVEASGKIRV